MPQVKSFVKRLLDRFRRLWPIRRETSRRPRRVPRKDAGRIWVADDFDDPLPPEIQKYFE